MLKLGIIIHMKNITLLLSMTCLVGLNTLAKAQTPPTAQRAGRLVGGENNVGIHNLKIGLTENLDLDKLNKEIEDAKNVSTIVVGAECKLIQEYIDNFEPREEIITVTVYRDGSTDGDNSSDDGGDDGGSGGAGDGGGGGGGCGGGGL